MSFEIKTEIMCNPARVVGILLWTCLTATHCLAVGVQPPTPEPHPDIIPTENTAPWREEAQSIQCARACVGVVLTTLDIPFTNEELTASIPTSSDGLASAEHMLHYLQRKGVDVAAVHTGPTYLFDHQAMAILYEEHPKYENGVRTMQAHFVAVVGYEGNRVCIFNSEADGSRSGLISTDKAFRYWSGFALVVRNRNTASAEPVRPSVDAGGTIWGGALLHWFVLPATPLLIAVSICVAHARRNHRDHSRHEACNAA